MPTRYMGTFYQRRKVYGLVKRTFASIVSRVSFSGEYTFKVEMSGLTAACTVELWISTDTDPMNMHKVAKLEYPEQV